VIPWAHRVQCRSPRDVSVFETRCPSYLQLKQRETPSSSCPSVVLDGGTLDNRLECIDRSWGNLCGFGETSGPSSVLSAWLVEVHSDSSLPVLVEMIVRDLVIVFDGLPSESVGSTLQV